MSTNIDASPPIFPYPTADEIEDIFAKVETPEELGNLRGLFTPSFHGEVMGHDHSFVGKHHGGDSWFEQLGAILSSLDHEKTFKLEIVQVIGGGNSPWASMEARASAKTKTGTWPADKSLYHLMSEITESKTDLGSWSQERITIITLCGSCASMAKERFQKFGHTTTRRISKSLPRR